MQDALRALAALGAFVAVPVWGLAIAALASGKGNRATSNVALAFPIGFAAWSVVLGFAAYAGVFHPGGLGILGWISAIALGWRTWPSLAPRIALVTVIGSVLALLACAYAAFPNESILGDRDQGLYTLMATLLDRTAGLSISAPPEMRLVPTMFKPFAKDYAYFLPGIYSTPTGLQFRFQALYPAWIAQFAAATAGFGLFRLNALLCALALPVFYVLVRRVTRASIAFAGTVALAVNPAQVWMARINLVEAFTQLLVLGGLLAACRAIDERRRAWALTAAALFGVACFVRLDVVMLVPLLFGIWLLARLWNTDRFAMGTTIGFLAFATLVAIGLACGFAAWTHPIYVDANRFALIAGGAAAAFTVACVPLTALRSSAWLRAPAARVLVAHSFVLGLTAVFMYAVFVRPNAAPYALIRDMTSSLDGTRDYREMSLHNLAAYVTWPALVLALAGACASARAIVRGAATFDVLLLCVVSLGVSIVMLANPHVSPDHFWAVRRFVPLVIPGVLIMMCVGMELLASRWNAVTARRVVAVAGVVLVAVLVFQQRHTLFIAENRGIIRRVEKVVEALPRNARVVFVRHSDAIADTLMLAYGVPVLPLHDSEQGVDADSRKLWSSCNPDRPCGLVHGGDYRGLAGVRIAGSTALDLSRRYVVPVMVPLPRETATADESVLVSTVEGLEDASKTAALVGAYRDWRFDDSGFHDEETDSAGSARWTRGDAKLALPAISADVLEIDIGAPRSTITRIELQGNTIFSGELSPGLQRIRVPLANMPAGHAERILRLTSPVVSGHDLGFNDDRMLGLRVMAVRQLDSRFPRLDASGKQEGYASQVTVMGGPRKPDAVLRPAQPIITVPLMVANVSAAVWPAPPDVLDSEQPVAVGIRWTRADTGEYVGEARLRLPFSLHPGERLRMNATLDDRLVVAGPLPDGEYIVEFDMVQEGVAWFSSRGGSSAKMRVRVVH